MWFQMMLFNILIGHFTFIYKILNHNIPSSVWHIKTYAHMFYALLITWFGVQYDQYFPSFSYFAVLFHKPLGK